MKFKKGDRVQVIHNSNKSGIVKLTMDKIGIVKSIDSSTMIYVEFDKIVYSDLSVIGFFKSEIKKVPNKNEQLLFDFMEEGE